MSDPPDPPPHSLDPERAVEEQLQRQPRQLPQPVIDTRPYRWAIGGFGILLVIVISIIEFANHGAASAGVKPGQRLISFAAPVATGSLIGDANISKPCSLGYFGARAVNTCLLVRRGPLVLGFFVAGVSDCERTVDTMQSLSHRYASSGVQFVAVAASSSRAATLHDIRTHHWTIPVAYDRDGALAQVYGVEVCPMVELAYRGGVVKSLLFGDQWNKPGQLDAKVRSLIAAQRLRGEVPIAEELELRAAAGFVEPSIHDEFPGLRLDWLTVGSRRPLDSPREVKRRLRLLSNRYRGASVVAMRTQPIPNAYRTFFRQIGLDPDTDRIPSEAAAVARLMRGGFEPSSLIDDARLIALIETGVPLWALDASFVDPGGPGIRTSVAGERIGAEGPLVPGRLVVADETSIHAVLFGDVVPEHAVGPRTERIVLYALSVDGVPAIHVEEALWVCLEVLQSRGQ